MDTQVDILMGYMEAWRRSHEFGRKNVTRVLSGERNTWLKRDEKRKATFMRENEKKIDFMLIKKNIGS